MKGEEYLMISSPTFKRRYGHDSDLYLGCKVECSFCYYKMIQCTKIYFSRNASLKRLATPKEFRDFLFQSRLVRENDLVIIGARGDASMYPKQIHRFIEIYNKLPVKNLKVKNLKFLFLHRPPVSSQYLLSVLKDFDNTYFGTTITPDAHKKRWTSVSEEKQIEGLLKLAKFIDSHRISIEIGPIIKETQNKAIEIMKKLNEFENLIIRGISIVIWNIDEKKKLEELKQCGFIDDQKYRDGKSEFKENHGFYKVKNYLEKEFFERLEKEEIINWHRYSFEVYAKWIPIALNRGNKVRISGFKPKGQKKAKRILEEWGFEVKKIEKKRDHLYIHLEDGYRATEDIAMTLGAELRSAVIFNNYIRSAEMSDVLFYAKNNLYYLPIFF